MRIFHLRRLRSAGGFRLKGLRLRVAQYLAAVVVIKVKVIIRVVGRASQLVAISRDFNELRSAPKTFSFFARLNTQIEHPAKGFSASCLSRVTQSGNEPNIPLAQSGATLIISSHESLLLLFAAARSYAPAAAAATIIIIISVVLLRYYFRSLAANWAAADPKLVVVAQHKRYWFYLPV